ncbi:terpene cyclase [Salix suchowensis]|nr:terpene cyclase [Salix suchowensis]
MFRRSAFYMYNYANDSANKLPYPNGMGECMVTVSRAHDYYPNRSLECRPLGQDTVWNTKSRITAVFLTHAIINDNAPSYVIPDSDGEAIIGESDDEWMDDDLLMKNMQQQCQKKAETNLQKWIVHLTALCKDEERKLRHLRKVDHDRRLSLYGPEYADVVYSDEDDEEYIDKTHQRRKISRD